MTPDYSKPPLIFWSDYKPFVEWRKAQGYTQEHYSLEDREAITVEFTRLRSPKIGD